MVDVDGGFLDGGWWGGRRLISQCLSSLFTTTTNPSYSPALHQAQDALLAPRWPSGPSAAVATAYNSFWPAPWIASALPSAAFHTFRGAIGAGTEELRAVKRPPVHGALVAGQLVQQFTAELDPTIALSASEEQLASVAPAGVEGDRVHLALMAEQNLLLVAGAASHRRIDLSLPALATVLPSGAKATVQTSAMCFF